MALTVYADVEDVRDAYEGTIPDDVKTTARLISLLRRASAKLAQQVPGLDRRMGLGEIDPEIPAGMVVEAILRVWRNPAGMTQQGVGPFQGSYNSRASMNEIIFDAEEIAWLRGERDAVPSSFTVAYKHPESPVDPLVDARGTTNVTVHPWGF